MKAPGCRHRDIDDKTFWGISRKPFRLDTSTLHPTSSDQTSEARNLDTLIAIQHPFSVPNTRFPIPNPQSPIPKGTPPSERSVPFVLRAYLSCFKPIGSSRVGQGMRVGSHIQRVTPGALRRHDCSDVRDPHQTFGCAPFPDVHREDNIHWARLSDIVG